MHLSKTSRKKTIGQGASTVRSFSSDTKELTATYSYANGLKPLIVPYQRPSIYAFLPFPDSFPLWVKVGFTQRPGQRIEEWRKFYPDLAAFPEFWDAAVDSEHYFMDHAVHAWLKQHGCVHIERWQMPSIDGVAAYYSTEIYSGPTKEKIDAAVADIQDDYNGALGGYAYYSVLDGARTQDEIEQKGPYTLRPDNQQVCFDNALSAIRAGRTRLLMFAPPRFGKTFTSLMIAKEIRAKYILVVSAKADVESEWRDTVLGIRNFSDNKWAFVTSGQLAENPNLLGELQAEGRTAVVFCTLQDLQGRSVKRKHKPLFEFHVDMLIVDETHFGARSSEFGAKLRDEGSSDVEGTSALAEDADEAAADIAEADETLSSFSDVGVWLHLSGTPYRIMMSDEFDPEDVVYAARYPETIRLRDKWYEDNTWTYEWENPLFGTPDILTMAFNICLKGDRGFADKLDRRGIASISELHAVWPKTGKFKYPGLVSDFWHLLDGSKTDAGVIALFADKEMFADRMGTQILSVLPSKAACAALERMFEDERDTFNNFAKYHILNITPLDESRKPSVVEVKKKLAAWDEAGEFSMTLTVNRMLTGSTVPQWNTMLHLKGGSSAQDYDQAKCRLLTPHTRKYANADGDEFVENLKPQVLFIDFEPGRVFEMEAQLAFAEVESHGGAESGAVVAKMKENLGTSPVVLIDAIKQGGIQKVNAADVMEQIARYNELKDPAARISDTDLDLGVYDDEELSDALKAFSGAGIGGSGKIPMNANETEGDPVGVEPQEEGDGGNDPDEGAEDPSETGLQNGGDSDDGEKALKDELAAKKEALRNYVMRIAMATWALGAEVSSLSELLEAAENDDDKEKLRKLGLDWDTLSRFHEQANGFFLFNIDKIVYSVSKLVHDDTMSELEKLEHFYRTFKRVGASEIITPLNVARKMVGDVGDEALRACVANGDKLLDFSSEMGEYSVALMLELESLGYAIDDFRENICALAASSAGYVMTCRTYEMLGLDTDNIYANFDVFDVYDRIGNDSESCENMTKILCQNGKLISEILLDDELGDDDDMFKFGAVVGNPPYHQSTDNGNKTFSGAMYPKFWDLSAALSKRVVLIIPGRFLFNAGSTHKDWNKKMLSDPHLKVEYYEQDSSKVFANTDIKGGVAIIHKDEDQDFGEIGTFTAYPLLNSIYKKVTTAQSFNSLRPIVFSRTIYRLTKTLHEENPMAYTQLSRGHLYDMGTNIFDRLNQFFFETKPEDGQEYVRIFGRQNNQRVYRWIKRSYVNEPINFTKYKLIVPKSNGSGALGEVLTTPLIGEPLIGEPLIGVTETFMTIGAFDTEDESNNALKYIKSKFARVMLGVLKITQDNPPDKWAYVPMQDFTSNSDIDWTKSITEIDQQLYKKYGLDDDEIKFIEEHVSPME